MTVISTGLHPKLLWPGLHAVVMASYAEWPEEFSKMFKVETSDKAYEEDVETSAFDLPQVKAEGSAVVYTGHSQGFTKRYTHVAFGLGFIVTKEEKDDNLYAEVTGKRGPLLARSFRIAKEIVHANVLNRATSSSYVGGDGVSLLNTAHPTLSGNQSNKLATPADLSEASLEDVLTMIRTAKNSKGHPIRLQPKMLITSPQDEFNAARILGSDLQNDTSLNAINAIKKRGLLSAGFMGGTYLTDPDQWFVSTDAPAGMLSFTRQGYEFTNDGDFDTDNLKHKGYERYSCGWTDWRGMYGSEGS